MAQDKKTDKDKKEKASKKDKKGDETKKHKKDKKCKKDNGSEDALKRPFSEIGCDAEPPTANALEPGADQQMLSEDDLKAWIRRECIDAGFDLNSMATGGAPPASVIRDIHAKGSQNGRLSLRRPTRQSIDLLGHLPTYLSANARPSTCLPASSPARPSTHPRTHSPNHSPTQAPAHYPNHLASHPPTRSPAEREFVL